VPPSCQLVTNASEDINFAIGKYLVYCVNYHFEPCLGLFKTYGIGLPGKPVEESVAGRLPRFPKLFRRLLPAAVSTQFNVNRFFLFGLVIGIKGFTFFAKEETQRRALLNRHRDTPTMLFSEGPVSCCFLLYNFDMPSAKRLKKRRAGAVALVLFFAFLVWLFWGLPLPTKIAQGAPVSTKILDRNGQLIFEIFTEQKRTPLELDDVPKHAVEATIAIEDKDFYRHHGFSVDGMARALYRTVFEGKLEGGSTLTQQLVKNALLTPERTVKRKIREFVLAGIVEIRYSKDEILELYLNQIPYGSTAYGIEAASNLYFDKSAKDLSLAESALLAGLPAAPTRFNPFGVNPDLARERQKAVLRRMVEDAVITEEEADSALAEELHFAQVKAPSAPHFALWVKEILAERWGERMVEQGGLRVTTSLDLSLQRIAEEAVAEEVAKLAKLNVGNGAALVMRPASGEILAMVGSKDFFAQDEDGKVNIIFAERQPGSAIKPLNYALGVSRKKLTAATSLADVPTCFNVAGQESYCPVNYDGGFTGATQVRFALGNSRNIPAVRTLALNGLANFVEFAQKMGIKSYKDPSLYGLSITLGGGELRPIDLATAYAVFANGGVKQNPIAILKVEDWKGNVLSETKIPELEGDRVLDGETAFVISHILHDNNARSQAFGASSLLNVRGHPEVSVKTGTTNDLRDNWTVGYTKHMVALSWVGNNDNEPMAGAVSGISGATPIWNVIMKEALDRAEEGAYNKSDKGHAWPKQPTGIVGATICANTGLLPGEGSADCPTRFEFFLEGTVPTESAFRQDLHVDRVKNALSDENSLPQDIEVQNHLVVIDPLGTIICLDCPFQMNRVTVNTANIKNTE